MHLYSVLGPSCAVAVRAIPCHGGISTDAVRMDCTLGIGSPSVPFLVRDLDDTLPYYAVASSLVGVLQLSPLTGAVHALVVAAAAAAELAAACSTVHSMACNILAVLIANCAAVPAPR